MTKRYLNFLTLSLLFLGFGVSVQAQNLVPNPGFELQDTCPAASELFLAPPWNSPTPGSPDLFNNTCSSQQGQANAGIGCAGIFCYNSTPGWENNREYMQVQLDAPLQAGQGYCMSFYVRRLTFFTYAIDRIGAHFSTSALSVTGTSALTSYTPQVEHTSLMDGSGYELITGGFVATGGEEYLIIGNFQNDAALSPVDVENNGNLRAYYYIDDISVTACNTIGIGEQSPIITSVYPNPSTGMVNITSDNVEDLQQNLRLTDISGKTVNYQLVNASQNSVQLDLSELSNGIYFVTVITATGAITEKLILNK